MDVEVFSGVISLRPALIFPELHIQNPVQFVLNLPMAAFALQYLSGGHALADVNEIVRLF